MYVQDGKFKIKLFTKLANQNSYDEARAIGRIYSYLLPRLSRPARFYILPKIHKNKQNPPGRPIVFANSHPTENISQFVDSHLNPLVPKLPSYVKDTTHFLKKLDDLKELPLDPFL